WRRLAGAAAEGATAPESLRRKDRANEDALESGCRRLARRHPTEGVTSGRRPGEALRFRDRGGIGNRRHLAPFLPMRTGATDERATPSTRRLAPAARRAHGRIRRLSDADPV